MPKQASNPQKEILDKIARETHEVVEDGRRVHRSTFELIVLMIFGKMIQGDMRAFRAWQKLREELTPTDVVDQKHSYLVVPRSFGTIDEWEEYAMRQPMPGSKPCESLHEPPKAISDKVKGR